MDQDNRIAQECQEAEEKRMEYVQSLREAADWFQSHPHIPTPDLVPLSVYAFPEPETPELVRKVALQLGKFEKEYTTWSLVLVHTLPSGMQLRFVFFRHNVCHKRVIGVKRVKELVPDPDAPQIEVEREIEEVQWDCPPVLGGGNEK